MSDWKDEQLNKWMQQLEKPVSPSRSWYWQRLRSVLDRLARRAIRERGEKGIVIDFGGGLAPLSRHWCRDFPQWRVVLSDLSESDLRMVGMLDSAPDRLMLHADSPAIRPQTLDVIVCSEVVEHLPAPERLLADFYDWLKPGGILIMSTPNGGHPLVNNDSTSEADALDPLATNAVGFGHISIHSTKQWMAWLESVGFESVTPFRGALLFGGPKWDNTLRMFTLMGTEIVLDLLNAWNWSESAIIKARKPSG